MDQMHNSSSSMPHIVQVYPSSVESKIQNPQIIHLTHPSITTSHASKVTYQQAVSTESMTILQSDLEQGQQVQSQIVMSCQQGHLQNLQSVSIQSQVIHTDVPPLQFASHVLLPQLPVFKQHVLVEQESYLGHYGSYLKDHSYPAKVDLEQGSTEPPVNQQPEYDQSTSSQPEVKPTSKRKRGLVPNPSTWACNVRKIKHQSGEAYISRRGKYVPERKIKSTKDCLTSCKLKCNKKISDSDRELIFKAFYSLTSNEKKHFLLNTTERHEVRQPKVIDGSSKRLHTFKYYFLVRGTRHAVCKNFYLGTLSISQKPVYNVHAGKSELNTPKPDGRGLSPASYHGLPASTKDTVREHIMSFKTVDSAPIKQFSKKQQHLQGNYSVKQMYNMYLAECNSEHAYSVKQSMYRKILKQEFNIHFKTKSNQLCAKCKEPIKTKSSEKSNNK